MKLKKKLTLIIMFAIMPLVLVFCVLINFHISFLPDYWPGYSLVSPTGARDENGNMIIVEEIPYFGYIEKAFWDKNNEDLELFEASIYQSKEYDEYYISDYKDGICINRYVGNAENLIIPETIDGKKVIKLGSYYGLDIDIGYFESSAFSKPFDIVNYRSIYIPSGVKEISASTFTSMCPGLREIIVDEKNPYYYSKNGNLYSKEVDKLLVAPRISYGVGQYTMESINK